MRADLVDCLFDLGYRFVSEAGDTASARELLENDLPDLAFLDIHLGKGEDGVSLARRINREYRIPFIFLTAYSDDLTLSAVKETLPTGFVLKPFHEQRLKAAIEIALHTYYAVIRPHWRRIEDINDQLPEALTPRELDLLTLLCEGHSNRELAARLHLSVNTIKTHLKNLYLKLDVKNRAETIVRMQAMD